VKRALALCALLAAGCALQERGDYLVGRECTARNMDRDCDPGQRCLPHEFANDRYDDFRCRDRASFEFIGDREPPIAYCDETMGFICPGDLVCNADRIRVDATTRRRVCKLKDDLFSPPLDGGM
jgi:hypothetical protein